MRIFTRFAQCPGLEVVGMVAIEGIRRYRHISIHSLVPMTVEVSNPLNKPFRHVDSGTTRELRVADLPLSPVVVATLQVLAVHMTTWHAEERHDVQLVSGGVCEVRRGDLDVAELHIAH